MRLIKKGRAQKGWAKEFVCTGDGNGGGGCGAKLLVDMGDLFQTQHTSYDGSTDHYITFRCCECGVETDVQDEAPMSLLDEIPWKKDWLKTNGERTSDMVCSPEVMGQSRLG